MGTTVALCHRMGALHPALAFLHHPRGRCTGADRGSAAEQHPRLQGAELHHFHQCADPGHPARCVAGKIWQKCQKLEKSAMTGCS